MDGTINNRCNHCSNNFSEKPIGTHKHKNLENPFGPIKGKL